MKPGYWVTLRDTVAEEQRAYWMELPWSEGSIYWWAEGNFSCDCNRGMTFIRAGGREPEQGEYECGEGRFYVRCYDDNGRLLYDDAEDR